MSTVKICIPEQDGKVLTTNVDGSVSCGHSGIGSEDSSWILIKANSGNYEEILGPEYFIVSKNYKMTLDYDPSESEQIATIPFNNLKNHTRWHISEKNEIYTLDGDVKKYLWSAMGNIYVTHDEYLAEGWQAISLEGEEIVSDKKEQINASKSWPIIALVLCLILLLWNILRRRSI